MISRNTTTKFVFLLAIFIAGFFIFTNNFAFAVGETTYCAEKTVKGAWCQNVPLDQVDKNYRYVPASCEATSYCKLGTCVNSQEGICLENTPQKICEQPEDGAKGGVWYDKPEADIPQCSLGCCILGDQASFVTQTRCKQLSSLYGLQTNYRTDITSEAQCISSVSSQVKGACVFNKDSERTCKFTTQADCQSIGTSSSNSSAEFHKDLLCSAEELATNCGPSEKTTVVNGKDEVYFVDTCGNIANIYDASKVNDQNYWRDVVSKENSCGANSANGNAGSATCGNCDYFLGSTGKAYDRSTDPNKPKFGDYICRDLGCTYQGKEYKHGETWCSTSSGTDSNLPGDKYFRNVCYNGEVTVEPCADFRQEVCIQDEVNGFKTASCVVNKWQDCTSQDSQKGCENTDKRDCTWIPGQRFDGQEFKNDTTKQGSCVPKYAPGFDTWKAGGDAESLCVLANRNCVVKYEKGLLDGSWKCVDNCDCLTNEWVTQQNNICLALGDCGSTTNFANQQGYNSLDDLTKKVKGDNTTSSA